MSSRRRPSSILPLFALVAALASLPAAPAAAADEPVPGLDRRPSAAAPLPAATGFIAPALAADHLADASARAKGAAKALPARYDCREAGLVSPIRNQGACGACYAFGAAADLESRLLAAGWGPVDISENALKECHYQDSSCAGGNQYLIMNHLTRQGAVLESCDPYVAADVGCTAGCATQFQVLDWSAVSGGTVPATAVLKQYLLDHGPLQTTLFAGDATTPAWSSAFNGYNGTTTLRYTGAQAPNHSVVLVGWDDALVHAGGTGGWICKNSWGTGWGGTCGYGSQAGYFTIAYGSASVGMWSSFIGELMAVDPAAAVLSHDEGGYTAAFGGVGLTLWGLARHDAAQSTYLHRIEFWTTDATSDVDVYVYDTFSGGVLSGLLASSQDHAFPEAGYHHVELLTPLPLAAGQDIYVAVRTTNASYAYPLAVDVDGPAASNRSWYSVSGSSWTSLYASGADVTIRVRTSTETVLAIEDGGEGDGGDLPPVNAPVTLRLDEPWPNPFNPATNLRYALPRAGEVTVSIHDLQGRLVRVLERGSQGAGEHQVAWDGRDERGRPVPSGPYLGRVAWGDQVRAVKLALLK
jgi:C1A family cysteine protease